MRMGMCGRCWRVGPSTERSITCRRYPRFICFFPRFIPLPSPSCPQDPRAPSAAPHPPIPVYTQKMSSARRTSEHTHERTLRKSTAMSTSKSIGMGIGIDTSEVIGTESCTRRETIALQNTSIRPSHSIPSIPRIQDPESKNYHRPADQQDQQDPRTGHRNVCVV